MNNQGDEGKVEFPGGRGEMKAHIQSLRDVDVQFELIQVDPDRGFLGHFHSCSFIKKVSRFEPSLHFRRSNMRSKNSLLGRIGIWDLVGQYEFLGLKSLAVQFKSRKSIPASHPAERKLVNIAM